MTSTPSPDSKILSKIKDTFPRQSRTTTKRNDIRQNGREENITPKRTQTPGPIRLNFDLPVSTKTAKNPLRYRPSDLGSNGSSTAKPKVEKKLKFEDDVEEIPDRSITATKNLGFVSQSNRGHKVMTPHEKTPQVLSPRSRTHAPMIRNLYVPQTNISNINPRAPQTSA